MIQNKNYLVFYNRIHLFFNDTSGGEHDFETKLFVLSLNYYLIIYVPFLDKLHL